MHRDMIPDIELRLPSDNEEFSLLSSRSDSSPDIHGEHCTGAVEDGS